MMFDFPADQASETVQCTVYPAAPSGLTGLGREDSSATRSGTALVLANRYLRVQISPRSGAVVSITNKLTGRRNTLAGDRFGVVVSRTSGKHEWMAAPDAVHAFAVRLDSRPARSRILLTEKWNGLTITVVYVLSRDQFWVERKLTVKGGGADLCLDRLVYGNLDFSGAEPHVIELGVFDRPRLVPDSGGGVFGGVGWWFYSVSPDGVYQNTEMAYTSPGRLESEPWYLGVFRNEAGEPFPGWLWYRTFLQARKDAHDKEPCWSYWNAGWGQWGIDVDDPSAASCLELARKMGIRGILFGGGGMGKGTAGYIDVALNNPVARENLALAKRYGISAGFLDSGYLGEKWADPHEGADKTRLLVESVRLGYAERHFDFFKTVDSFTAHRNAADYFRLARSLVDYTECHLGMAHFGPQFQREVLINHPNDLAGFDISRFSSDWATFLGFRYSRAEWQRGYHYLMPECGLYYYLTHYSNFGHPRRYVDPEPQQLLYSPQAYCGIAYNFHDQIGFRDVLAAASAFSPYYVFGHLDLQMPERDVAYSARFLRWVRANVKTLRPGRVCLETDDFCVMSKIADGKGVVYILNYSPGERQFALKLETGVRGPVAVRPVYPTRGAPIAVCDGESVTVAVRGESVAILDVNNGLKTLPPQNPGGVCVGVTGWTENDGTFQAEFLMPDIRKSLAELRDPSLPNELLSLDQDWDTAVTDMVRVSPESEPISAVSWLGCGKLPEPFVNAYGFRDKRRVETWKLAPWAFADRVWFVYRPAAPIALNAEFPILRINAKAVAMYPRVDYRQERWNCPLFYTDITSECKYGERNLVTLSELGDTVAGGCSVIAAAGEPFGPIR